MVKKENGNLWLPRSTWTVGNIRQQNRTGTVCFKFPVQQVGGNIAGS